MDVRPGAGRRQGKIKFTNGSQALGLLKILWDPTLPLSVPISAPLKGDSGLTILSLAQLVAAGGIALRKPNQLNREAECKHPIKRAVQRR